MHLAETPDPRQTQPRHFSGFAKKDLEVLSEKPLPFFDTALENTIYALTHMPKPDRRPRDGNKVSQLIGFSSSLYGLLEQEFLELMIDMLGEEYSTHLEREVPQEKYPTTPEWVQAVKREVDEVLLPRAPLQRGFELWPTIKCVGALPGFDLHKLANDDASAKCFRLSRR